MHRMILFSISLLFLVSCGQTKVTLLPDADGTTGQVYLANDQTRITLDKAYASAVSKSKDGQISQGKENPETISRDYGSLLKAEPAMPVSFILYFESGSTRLVPASKALIPQIQQAAQDRAPCEINIIGHTDTVGTKTDNVRLSMERAKQLGEQLEERLPGDLPIHIQGFGEYDLLVPTPDNTPRAENRRVEIMIR